MKSEALKEITYELRKIRRKKCVNMYDKWADYNRMSYLKMKRKVLHGNY